MEVTIKRSGFDTIIAEVPQGTTVKALLDAREINTNGMEIRLDGSTVGVNTQINQSCELRILKQVSGN